MTAAPVAAVNQNFNWQAEPSGNDTSHAGASLNLLFNSGTNSPAETGLKLASNGQITFATGQTFAGAGGTVTSVGSGAGLGPTWRLSSPRIVCAHACRQQRLPPQRSGNSKITSSRSCRHGIARERRRSV